ADPWTEIEGERAHPKSRHPILNDPAVRSAMSMLVDKQSIQNFIYGRTGLATANFLNNPSRFVSKNMKYEFNPDKAAATLEAAGWKRGSDGVRTKDGKRLKFVFQTSINAPRQKTQQIVKQAAQKAGIDLELKSVTVQGSAELSCMNSILPPTVMLVLPLPPASSLLSTSSSTCRFHA
ncbi:MAG: hypothetical protein EBX56_04465, partial [Betaproteobacteria bacterium]|nr:hypothetical protein [Betaproteobacteria bacterium]